MTALMILFLCHFVADFLMQPRWMAELKSSRFAVLSLHCIAQWALPLFVLMPFYPEVAMYVTATNAIIHGVIDWNIWKLYKLSVKWRSDEPDMEKLKANWKYWEDHWFYATIGLDQLLHSLTLIFVWWMWLV